MLVSIIVPVYNVQEYVRRTIECLQNQSYKEIEIVVVDDGSVDNSGKICDECASQDHRIKVFHKQNEGVSKARNFGLRMSTGSLFTFVDSDDLVDENYVKTLVEIMCREHVGIVRPVWKKGNKVLTYNIQFDNSGEFPVDKEHLYDMRFCNSIWGLYDKRLFSDLFFKENIHLCEDTLFTFSAFMKCGKMVLTNKACYDYIDRSDSVCHQKISEKQLTIRLAHKEMYELVGENPFLHETIEKFEFGTLVDLHRKIVLGGTYKDCRDEFKKIRSRIISLNKKWLKKERFTTQVMEYIFLYCPPYIASMCYKLNRLKK